MRKERELLTEIAAISDLETAEKAADRYSPEKHPYSFDGYIYQLEKLKVILLAGIPAKAAFELVPPYEAKFVGKKPTKYGDTIYYYKSDEGYFYESERGYRFKYKMDRLIKEKKKNRQRKLTVIQ